MTQGWGIGAAIALVLTLVCSAARADRNELSLAERVALADHVLVATVASTRQLGVESDELPNYEAKLSKVRMLKGEPIDAVAFERQIGWGSSPSPVDLFEGQQLILFAQKAFRSGPPWLINRYDGAIAATPSVLAEVERLAALECCSWKDGPDGLRVMLFSERTSFSPDEKDVSLSIFVQNQGAAEVAMHYVRQPLDQMTRAELTVTHDGRPVAPKTPEWHDPKGTAAYFAKRDPYDFRLPPGETWQFHVQRISTAVRGWGYKEDTSFQYFPMTKPGTYQVSAKLHAMLPGVTLETNPVELSVQPGVVAPARVHPVRAPRPKPPPTPPRPKPSSAPAAGPGTSSCACSTAGRAGDGAWLGWLCLALGWLRRRSGK